MLKVTSDLPAETDELATRVLGSCIDVHRILGPGLLEKIYGGLLLNVNVAILQNGMKRTVL